MSDKSQLLGGTEVKWLQAALLGKTKVFFVADQYLFRIGVATDALIAFSDLKVPRRR